MRIMPRREWLSLAWVLKCSVRLVMRSDRIAICTSGDPVSLAPVACSATTSFLRSGVIIFQFRTSGVGKIEDAKRLKLSFGDFGQCHGRTVFLLEEHGQPLEFVAAESITHAGEQIRADEDGVAGSDANRIGATDGQRRDAVQRGRQGPQIPKSGGTMHKRGY